MTFVEFFDNDPIQNVTSALLYSPERVLLVGKHKKVIDRYAARYAALFEQRGRTVAFEVKCPEEQTLQGYVAVLTDIVSSYPDCVFDVDGGDQLMMIAFGIVYARFPDKNIRLHHLNTLKLTDADFDHDGVTLQGEPLKLKAEEVVCLHGGDVVYSDVHGDKTYRWDMDDDFRRDVAMMWSLCRENTKRWNIQIGVFQSAKMVGHTSEDGLTVTADLMSMQLWLDEKDWKFMINPEVLKFLEQHGLISAYSQTSHTFSVTFKNLQVKRCLTKAGQVFEMFVYATICSLKNEDGTPMYDDVANGVFIDWDGIRHDDADDTVCDTENEIDVMTVHGITPIFISCKSGRVEPDEVYKLHTVARRFGGENAKMVLVATTVESEYVRQRMLDMGIYLIDRLPEMSDAEAAKAFSKLWAKNVNDNIQQKK